MSALPSTRPVTLDDFERLPDTDGIQELLDGVVIEMPPPKLRHSALVKRMAKILERDLPESRVWAETGFVIGPHCVQPDVAVIHSGQANERGWFQGAPLVAIEVASRGNTPKELERKKDLYLATAPRKFGSCTTRHGASSCTPAPPSAAVDAFSATRLAWNFRPQTFSINGQSRQANMLSSCAQDCAHIKASPPICPQPPSGLI